MCVCAGREEWREREKTVVEISERCNAAIFEDEGKVL